MTRTPLAPNQAVFSVLGRAPSAIARPRCCAAPSWSVAFFPASRFREALLVLVQEGLATHSQNRGFTVPELSQRDLADINEARVPMEALALELGRARCTPARIAAIERLKDELVASFRAEDVNRLALLDLEFHAAVWESAENPWLAAALRRILGPYFTFAGIQDIRSPHLTEQLLESQHRLFLDFLKGECDRTALECVQFHLEITRKR